MADGGMPVAHWVSRLTILFVLAVVVFAVAFTGAATRVTTWTVDNGLAVVQTLWSPLLDGES